jgi:hypothetical protein
MKIGLLYYLYYLLDRKMGFVGFRYYFNFRNWLGKIQDFCEKKKMIL